MTCPYIQEGTCNRGCRGFQCHHRQEQAVSDLSKNQLLDLCVALGWQGGTFHQVLAEVKRLRATGPDASRPTREEVDNLLSLLKTLAGGCDKPELALRWATVAVEKLATAAGVTAVLPEAHIPGCEPVVLLADVVFDSPKDGVGVAPHETFSRETPMPSDKDEPR